MFRTSIPPTSMIASLALTLAACGDFAARAPIEMAGEVEYEGIAYEAAEIGYASADVARPSSRWMSAPDRMITRSGMVRVEVSDVDAAVSSIEQIVGDVDGYVASSSVAEGREGARRGDVTVRVPAASFAETMADVGALGKELANSVHAADITREYTDLEIRLAVKEETADRLRTLLGRTGDLSDVLEVERELGRVVTEIEQMKGQIRYYDRQVAESEIAITLVEPGSMVRPGAFTPIAYALRNAFSTLAGSVAALIYLLVVVTPWAVVALSGWWLVRRRRRAAPASPPSTPADGPA
ncbi:MAG: DUF4349 domain-containing protein [Gemmatimonadota bacterium]|nr:DUF4349 domain-containing protein [Gemmatimonadota bacterium]